MDKILEEFKSNDKKIINNFNICINTCSKKYNDKFKYRYNSQFSFNDICNIKCETLKIVYQTHNNLHYNYKKYKHIYLQKNVNIFSTNNHFYIKFPHLSFFGIFIPNLSAVSYPKRGI